ncbi:putative short-chain dehydrogenase [Xylariaceae sp. FL0255]|nr:putative short-chain dehydrogenase [Xylariaceae sp. FL0255]
MSSSPLSPYAEQHNKNATGAGAGRPTAIRILEDNNLVQAWSEKVVLITGATSGIGIETARAMYATGAKVYLVVRNPAKMQPIITVIVDSVKGGGGSEKIEVIQADLDSLGSVKNAAKEFLRKSSKLNVLINNAGILACPPSTTTDGYERQLGVNYLAHFTLTTLLLPALQASSSPSCVSRPKSRPQTTSTVCLYGSGSGSGSSSVRSFSLCPGGIWTNLQVSVDASQIDQWKADAETQRAMKSPAQGAATSVWAAVGTALEGRGGLYLADCKVAGPLAGEAAAVHDGFGPDAYDPVREARLWEMLHEIAADRFPGFCM